MAPACSKFDTLPFNCYESGHTWLPHCTQAAAAVGLDGFKEGLRIYASMFLLSSVLSRRIPKSLKDVKKAFQDIIRSATFLGMNPFGFIFFFCKIRQLKGNFNYFTLGFVPSLIACYCAILVEKPKRRSLLGLYVANVATDAVIRMLKSRGIIREIKHFDVLVFCLSCVTMIYQMKKGNRRGDIVDSVFSKILGSEEFPAKKSKSNADSEANTRVSNERDGSNRNEGSNEGRLAQRATGGTERLGRLTDETYRARFIKFVLWMHRSVEDIACHLERMVTAVYEDNRHELCPHKEPCFSYWMKGFTSRFASGFGLRLVLEAFQTAQRMIRRNKSRNGSNSVLYSCCKTGLGISAMCLCFRVFSCSFRWLKETDTPCDAALSSILGSALGYILLNPSSFVMYLFFKVADNVISASHKSNNWKIINWIDSIYGGGWCVVYAISTALIFHFAMVEPQVLKPSYYKFLNKVTGNKTNVLNRHLYTVYNENSNMLMKDVWFKFTTKYLSHHMKKLIEMRKIASGDNMASLVRPFVNLPQ